MIFIASKAGNYKIEQIVNEAECEAIVAKTITILEVPTSILPNQLSSIKSSITEEKEQGNSPIFIIYTNPNEGEFSIQADVPIEGKVQLKIYDAQFNRLLYSGTHILSDMQKIEVNLRQVSSKERSIYVIIVTEKEQYVQRVFIR